jgi:hypothetical protein
MRIGIKILYDLLIWNKKPRSSLGNGVFISQSILPSTTGIRDGTLNCISCTQIIARFPFIIYYIMENCQFNAFRKINIPPIIPPIMPHFIQDSLLI